MGILKKSLLILSSAVILNIAEIDAQAYNSALWPVDSRYNEITTYFDESRNYGNTSAHNAIDIPADYGANIYSAYDGTCISADWKNDYGYLIIIWHEDLEVYTFYSHCSSVSIYSGQTIKQGDIIGYVGNTGFSDGNHLHFGICDSLLGGFPCSTYYNPLTYFSYNAENTFEECDCSTDYSGIYTTHGVDTYLNIRNDHNTDSAVLGEIPPDSDIRVTKANGEWAHVEYNGITGFCAMEFLEKKGEITSGMSISDEIVPRGTLETGVAFSISGIITSDLPIKKVWGGIYENDGATPIFIAEDSINSLTYDLSGEFDKHIRFNDLPDGSYVYKIEAEDESGQKFTLISSIFYVGDDKDAVVGDINSDGIVNIADMVLLQQYLLGKTSLSATQYTYADINRDSVVDVFDMVQMRKIYN